MHASTESTLLTGKCTYNILHQTRMEYSTQISEYTHVCWDTCISSIKPALDRSDKQCMENCVNRFIDMTLHLANGLQNGSGRVPGL
jgi:hypothetical protein